MSNKSATTTLSQVVINNGKIFGEDYQETASTYEVFRNRKNILLDSLGALATTQSKDVHRFHDGKIALTDVTLRARDIVEVNLDPTDPNQRIFVELGPTGNVILNGKPSEIIYEIQPTELSFNTGSYDNYSFKVIRDGVDVTSQTTGWTFTAADSSLTLQTHPLWGQNTVRITAGYTAKTTSLTVKFTDFGVDKTYEIPVTITAVENFVVTLLDSDVGVSDNGKVWVQFKWKGEIIDNLDNASLSYSCDRTLITQVAPNSRPVYDHDKQAFLYEVVSGNREGNGWIIASASRPDGVHGEAKLTIPVRYKLLTITPDTYGDLESTARIYFKFEAKLGDTLIDPTQIKFTNMNLTSTPLPGDSRYLRLIGSYASYPLSDAQAPGRFYISFTPTHIGCNLTWDFDCIIGGRSYRGLAGSTWKINPAPITLESAQYESGDTHGWKATFKLMQRSGDDANHVFDATTWSGVTFNPTTTYGQITPSGTAGEYTVEFDDNGPFTVTGTGTVVENEGLANKSWPVSFELAPNIG